MNKIKYNQPWHENQLAGIISTIAGYYPKFDEGQKELVGKAFWYGKEAHKEQKRFSGDPYFIHPIAATVRLLSIRPDVETVCACLLHDVIEDTPITADEIENEFNKKIRFLCEGVEKVSKVSLKEDQKGQKLETIKKLFLAVAEDIRVIFIKLADRIHNLETLGAVRPEKRRRIARESMEVYAPVAGQLGLFAFKQTMEDLCFQHLHPDDYDKITKEISEHAEAQEAFIEMGKGLLAEIMKKRGVTVLEIKGRRKNLHSIYQKLKRKNYSYATDLFDLIGFRVVVKTTPTCYRALGAIHSQWTSMPKRFKDYISAPKPNGYQSLHTTVLGFGGAKLPTEIQIRTTKMHLDAEFGPAAHWAYKKSKSSSFDADYVKRTSYFPDRLLGNTDLPADEFFSQLSQQILSNRIYVFTPKGDTITLREGSTPVDFAYGIHTEVGNATVGAKVNGKIKPLNYKLQKGEIVEILTKKGRNPNPAWLEFVQTSMARQHIQGFVNKSRKKESETEDSKGKKEKKPHAMGKLKSLKAEIYPTGEIPLWAPIMIGGQVNIPHRLATCCSPVPYERLLAYKSRGLEYTVHKKTCDQLENLDKERLMDASYLKGYILELEYAEKPRGIGRMAMKALSQYNAELLEATPTESGYKIEIEMSAHKSMRKLEAKLLSISGITAINITAKK